MKKQSGSPWTRPKVTSIIAEREYHLVTRSGKSKKVIARFGRPRKFPEGSNYYCVYRIEGLEGEVRGDAADAVVAPGVDSVQALLGAMQLAWNDLFSSEAYREGRLSFFGMRDLGLPPLLNLVKKESGRRRTPRGGGGGSGKGATRPKAR